MQAAKSSAVRRSVIFTLRQERRASRTISSFAVQLRRYSQFVASICPGAAGIG